MKTINNRKILGHAVHLVVLLIMPAVATAYVGPGAGLSAIGSALALVGAILLGIVGFLWYPIKRIMRKIRSSKDSPVMHNPAANEKHLDSGPG